MDTAVTRETGTVVRYYPDRGFGWIQTPQENTIFYHVREVPDLKILKPGTVVSYEVAWDEQKRRRAVRIEVA